MVRLKDVFWLKFAKFGLMRNFYKEWFHLKIVVMVPLREQLIMTLGD